MFNVHFLRYAKSVKKMLSKKSKNNSLSRVLQYTIPKLYIGKEWYIGFMAYDPVREEMRRKRIKLNHIEGIRNRREYANDVIKRLTNELRDGWNPWIDTQDKGYKTFEEVANSYRTYITKLYNTGYYREETYIGYVSYLRNVEKYNEEKGGIKYIYQFDKKYITQLLEHIFIDRDNSAQTRNNYLTFLRVFSSFLVQHGYTTSKPTEGISNLRKSSIKKERTIIAKEDMRRLCDYLRQTNKHYLLACYILHYCFIRPKEMSQIKLSNFNIEQGTIFIPDTVSKNRKDATITLPQKVLKLMIELKIFDNPNNYYLFGDRFRPGVKWRSEKQFRDYWTHYVRKALKFPAKYKFYSLKDTGITEMLRSADVLTVRDQARHSSILMTDIYTPHDIKKANKLILSYNGEF